MIEKKLLLGIERSMSRRSALRTVGVGLAVVPLVGCSSSEVATIDGGELEGDGGTLPGTDAATGTDAAAAGGWATGGTASMTGRDGYADPFASGGGTACELACETTIGPCHTTSPLRQDVSDGWDGLPMRVAFRVVDPDCNPVEDAIVEIWHTNYLGVYSGRINAMCNEAESDRAAQYFRGYQRTDADGRVDFDSCFPGWYGGRAVHMHVRVMKGDYVAADNATAWVITQFLWSDELIGEIFASEPLYRDQGQPDTLLADDNVVGGAGDFSPYLFDVTRASDGAMIAAKTLVIRASLSDAGCSASGAAGGGPPPR